LLFSIPCCFFLSFLIFLLFSLFCFFRFPFFLFLFKIGEDVWIRIFRTFVRVQKGLAFHLKLAPSHKFADGNGNSGFPVTSFDLNLVHDSIEKRAAKIITDLLCHTMNLF
jgi:hypothetical protein